MAFGFITAERVLRISGLALFLFCILKLFVYDLRELDTLSRIVSFIVLGLLLLGASWIYTRFREQFGQSFVAVWGAALFAIAWSLGSLFVWASLGIGYLIYEILAALGVVRIAGETRTKEVLELA